MSRDFQAKHKNLERSLFHHGLIYVIVRLHLDQVDDDCNFFLTCNGYGNPLAFDPI